MRIILAAVFFGAVIGVLANQPPDGAVIVPVDLAKPLIRVVTDCEHIPPESVVVDVGFSQQLTERPRPPSPQILKPQSVVVHTDEAIIGAFEAVAAATTEYSTVVERLRNSDEFHGVFEAGIPNTIVGVYVKRANRRDQAVVEIRPMYVLPSGAKRQLTKSAGMRDLKRTHALLADAMAAKAAVPKLQQAIRAAEREYERHIADSQLRANGRTLREYAVSGQSPSQKAAIVAGRAGQLQRQLNKAEQLSSNLKAIGADAKSTLAVATYSASLDGAAIWVRLSTGGKTLAAEVR